IPKTERENSRQNARKAQKKKKAVDDNPPSPPSSLPRWFLRRIERKIARILAECSVIGAEPDCREPAFLVISLNQAFGLSYAVEDMCGNLSYIATHVKNVQI